MIVLEAICFTVGAVLAYCVHRREQRLSGSPRRGLDLAVDSAAPGPDRSKQKKHQPAAPDDALNKRIRGALGAGRPRTKRGAQLRSKDAR